MGQVSKMWKDLNDDEKQFYADEIDHVVENVDPKINHKNDNNISSAVVKKNSITEHNLPSLGVVQVFQDNRSLSLSVSQNENTSITKQQKAQIAINEQALEAIRAQNESKRLDFMAKLFD